MKITKWNFTLTHDTYIDDLGMLLDRIQIEHNKTIYPIVPPMKVRNYSKENNVLDSTMWYTESELTEILEDFIQELNK